MRPKRKRVVWQQQDHRGNQWWLRHWLLELETRGHVIDLFTEPAPSRVMQAVPLN
jgi:hypothetical protein